MCVCVCARVCVCVCVCHTPGKGPSVLLPAIYEHTYMYIHICAYTRVFMYMNV